ncbi:MAG: radical SAM protein [Nitrospirae bacterium]|nr:MAG: radical SAM protein [Nitrospirota bacterium]
MAYSPFRHIGSIAWKRRPIQLTFFLTKSCNARCPFCFYLSRGSNSGHGPELSPDEIERISASMGRLLWLAFSGGEIFLRDDLADIVKTFYDRNKPSIILLTTNGLLTNVVQAKTEAILEYCKESSVVLKLSLDGPEEVHDSLRGTAGAFRKALETYAMLRGFIGAYPNFELGINSVFCAANQDRMGGFMEFVRGLDKTMTHTVSLIRGKVQNPLLKNVDMEKYLEIGKKLEADLHDGLTGVYRFRGARLKAAQDILQRRLIHDTAVQAKRLIPCYAGRLNLVLTETGDVYPCEAFDRKLGNVREAGYDIKTILKADKTLAAIKAIADSGCHCTHECYFMTNILFNPGQYPSLLKEYLRLRFSSAALSG